MPSNRRVKIIGLLVFIFFVTTLFYMRQDNSLSRSGSDTELPDDFYQKTVHALDSNSNANGKANAQAKLGGKSAQDDDDAGVRERLKKAADEAKGNANAKSPKPDPPSSIVGVGSAAEGSVAGRKTFPLKPKEGAVEEPVKKVETDEEHAVELEMNTILKKSPIIIFSKSYCPHSKRAKTILLEKYNIDPAPYVVELDLHPMGAQLQASLADMTSRKTVPNVLINGKSIGGGDEVAGLDSDDKLIATVKSMGGKRMVEVSRKTETEAPAPKAAVVEKEKGYEHDAGLKRRSKIIKKSM
ncbi:Monothiol glutaredoxin-7 [Phlyctema vagabunda]|uniref:Monothiol glutaredoxin-7 n=1 Tax=Phlyctema vagabunda TaxID=108571 RepID=A0ABR4PWU5_9HELO